MRALIVPLFLILLAAGSASAERIGLSQQFDKSNNGAYLFDSSGGVSDGILVNNSLGTSFVNCKWGTDVYDAAPISKGPGDVKISFLNTNGDVLKQIVIGSEWKVSSAHGADLDGSGACDLVVFGTDGSCASYHDPAVDGAKTSCGVLEAKKNYGLARSASGVTGFYAAGPIDGQKTASMALYDLSGAETSRVILPRVPINGVLALNHGAEPRFALVYGSSIEIVDGLGTVMASSTRSKGVTLAVDADNKGYNQLVTISGMYNENIETYDPAIGTKDLRQLSLYVAEPPSPDPTPTPTPNPLCAVLESQAIDLWNQGKATEAQAIVYQMIALGCFGGGPAIDPAPTGLLSYGPPYIYGALFFSSSILIRDNTGNGEGPCVRFYPVNDGYKQGLTVKNSDTRSGQIAALTPGGWITQSLLLMDPNTFKVKKKYSDSGYAFPDAKGARHLFRGVGTTRTIAGHILATEMFDGELRCWRLPKRPDNKLRFD